MHSLYQKIGAGVKGVRATPDEVFEAVKEALADLDEWNARNFQMMETISQWGDSADRALSPRPCRSLTSSTD